MKTYRMRSVPAVALCAAAVILWSMCSCGDDDGDPVYNSIPVVLAGNDTAVDVNNSLFLRASGTDSDGAIVSWSWMILSGTDTLAVYDTNIGTFRAPISPGDTLVCIASATDDSGGIGNDTMLVRLRSWLVEPDGGETFHAGDSCTVELRPIGESVGLNISVDDGEYLLGVPGVNEQIIPIMQPRTVFIVPDSLFDTPSQTWIPLASRCCRIRVFLYMSSSDYVESDSCFTVLPR